MFLCNLQELQSSQMALGASCQNRLSSRVCTCRKPAGPYGGSGSCLRRLPRFWVLKRSRLCNSLHSLSIQASTDSYHGSPKASQLRQTFSIFFHSKCFAPLLLLRSKITHSNKLLFGNEAEACRTFMFCANSHLSIYLLIYLA